jgi:hypothetical protein
MGNGDPIRDGDESVQHVFRAPPSPGQASVPKAVTPGAMTLRLTTSGPARGSELWVIVVFK